MTGTTGEFLDLNRNRLVCLILVIASILQKPILGLLVILLVFNLTQRRHLAYGEKKRFAALGLAVLFLILYAGIYVIVHFSSPDFTILFPLIAVILIAVLFRKRIFIFSFHCRECGKTAPVKSEFIR